MKQKLYFLTFLVLAGITWFACSKKNSSQIDVQSDGQQLNIGELHNKALAYYRTFESNKSKGKSTLSSQEEIDPLQVKLKIVDFLCRENEMAFKRSEIEEGQKKLDKKFGSSALLVKPQKGQILDNSTIIINVLRNNDEISEGFANELLKIYALTRQGDNEKVVLDRVINLKSKSFEAKDQKYLSAFVSVYTSSSIYWAESRITKKNNQNKLAKAAPELDPGSGSNPNCNLAIIAADATGALYGSIVGPAMSIVQAALFSSLAAINPPCENN